MDSTPAPLERYDAITDKHVFSLELKKENGAWIPARQLAMPHHHASSIVWSQRSQLDAFEGDRVVVVAIGEGSPAIAFDEARRTWFATYTAKVIEVCVAP